MRYKEVLFPIALALVVSISISSIASAASTSFVDGQLTFTETQITSLQSYKWSPAIYGDRIVWHDERSGRPDIYMYDFSTSMETRITTNESYQMFPDIYGDKIVWRDSRNDDQYVINWDVYMYDLSASKETQITNSKSDESFPKIYGNKIVWRSDAYSSNYDISIYDLSTSKETQVTTNESDQFTPVIYEDRIVWTDSRNGDYDIYMYNISTSMETQITTNESNQGFPAIYGDKIVWQDWRNGNSDIYMYDLSTKKETQITTNKSLQEGPAIYNDRIVWMDGRNGGSWNVDQVIGNWDIYMYDLLTSKETQITINESIQWEPKIYGDRIVWLDDRNGNYDIYMCTISGKEGTKLPVADFNSNVTEGYAPLTVQFYDLSQKAASRTWDFNSDGQPESNDTSPVHIYTNAGTYIVNLTVNNANGTASKTAAINVLTPSNSGGSSSGGGSHKSSGGSGGGGGSPEPAKNVEVKEISQTSVTNGKTIKFDFTKSATCVVYVSFDAKKTAGKTTTIAEQLKAKSTLTSNISSGEVYKSFNVWVGNAGFATEKNIENPVVCFKVEKSWLQDKNIDQNSITLNRYSDKKWLELPVKLLREDNKYLYFTAETPEFSFFAITGKTVEKEKVTEAEPATDTSKLERNGTAVLKAEQETGNGKVKNMPGFGMVCGIVCLITVFRYKRK